MKLGVLRQKREHRTMECRSQEWYLPPDVNEVPMLVMNTTDQPELEERKRYHSTSLRRSGRRDVHRTAMPSQTKSRPSSQSQTTAMRSQISTISNWMPEHVAHLLDEATPHLEYEERVQVENLAINI